MNFEQRPPSACLAKRLHNTVHASASCVESLKTLGCRAWLYVPQAGRPSLHALPTRRRRPCACAELDRQRQRLHQPRLVGHRDNGWRRHRADRKSAHLDRFTGRAVQPNGSEQLRLPSRCPRKVWRRSGEKPQNSVG